MPDELDVPVAGGQLRTAVWPGTGAPVLAIHGITSSSRSWPFLAAALDQPVFAPDLRGRGRSNHLPGPVGIAQHAEDCAAVIEAAGGTPVVVVGHSMGGFVATVLAARRPELVAGLVLVDGGLPFPAADETAVLAGLQPIKERLQSTYTRESYLDWFPFAVRLLPSVSAPAAPVFDTFGIVFVSLGSAGLILATSWGGTQYAWGSPTIIGLIVGGVACVAIFVYAEHRAAEPILPLRLFRRNVFSVSVVLSFIVGFALLGTMTFIPTFLQYCEGVSATSSGLRTLPMVIGLIIASVAAGNTVSRRGTYRIFPIAGAVVMAIGMVLLARLDEHSSFVTTSLAMLVLGVGIGLAMQVLTIIVQNTVDYRDLGVATSGVTFFRTMGSSFGAAVFGTIYANQLKPKLGEAVATTGADPRLVSTPETVKTLPAEQHAAVVHAYAESLQHVFGSAVPVAVVALLVALALKQVPMRGLTQPGATDLGHGFAMPDQRTSQEQLEGQVVRIIRTRLPEAAAELLHASRAGLDAVQVWTLRQVAILQLREKEPVDPVAIAAAHRVPMALIRPALDDVLAAGLLVEDGGADGRRVELSEQGRERFRAFVGELWEWLTAQVEEANGEPLDDQGREDLRAIARRVLLADDPISEPTELAQAGG